MQALSPWELLNEKFGPWNNIRIARDTASERRSRLSALIQDKGAEIRPDMSFVVFGSLARRESTSNSDIDWSLLVDGQTDPEDIHIAKRIEDLLAKDGWKRPGPSGVFGSLAFSHSIVHDIGGPSDNHVNTTRRVLLLLESYAVGDRTVRDRVVRALLSRYLEEDTHFHPENGSRSFVPRFLLNDVVRYWRTIAVDYANKTREANRAKWALRNIKLRMSRKLIFVRGLIMCFLCHLQQDDIQKQAKADVDAGEPSSGPFINYLVELIDQTPLDLLAKFLLDRNVSDATVRLVFEPYDLFLGALNDPSKRKQLEKLTYEEARRDKLFDELREAGKRFQEGLRVLFFDHDKDLARMCQVYAIF